MTYTPRSSTDSRYVNTDGDTMTGDLILNADPTADFGAVTKQYTDNISLTPGPPGPPGQSAGRIFYYATSDASDIATYKTMLTAPSAGSEQTINTACTGTSDVLVAVFATDPGVPGAVDYPAGTAFRRIYASVNAGTARLHLQVYVRSLDGTETLVRDEYSANFTDTAVALQEWNTSSSNAGSLLSTDRIVNKIYAQRVTGGPGGTVTVTTYWEGLTHASHIQTTISQSQPPLNTFKEPCRVVSTTNISSLIGLLTIDGVTLNNLDRVLLTGQTTTSENGIYYAQSSAWARAVDADASGEIADGMHVPITQGTLYADSLWRCTSTSAVPWIPGTSGSTWGNTGVVTLADEGTLVTPRRTVLNFTGDSVVVADDSANSRTNITVNALQPAEVLPGDNITVTDNANGTITITGAGEVRSAEWNWTATAVTTPGSQSVGTNIDNALAAAYVRIHYTNANGMDTSPWLKHLTTGDLIQIMKKSDASVYLRYLITGPTTDNTTWMQIPVSLVVGTTEPNGGAQVIVSITASGGGTSLPLIDAKGDLLVGVADNTAARLPVGTNNYVLTADSAETTGVKWAAAGSGSGIPPSTIDAKGDLLVGTANDTVGRLAVGTDGQVLTADAASAGGVKWDAVVNDGHSHTGSTISALDAGDTTTGTFNIARIPTGTTGTTVSLGNHNHAGVYDPAGTASSAVSTHAAAADPHTGYQKESEKSSASGYASLDAGIKVPIAELPTGTTSSTVSTGERGMPTGGTTGQALAKNSNTNYDATWQTVTVANDSHSHTGTTISTLDAGDTTTGTFNIARIPTGTTSTTVALGDAPAAVKSGAWGWVNHGSTAGTARPTGYGAIQWIGSVAPSNAVAGDVWVDTT